MDAGEGTLEGGLLFGHLQALQDYRPVLLESVVEEISLEAYHHGADEMDALHLHSVEI